MYGNVHTFLQKNEEFISNLGAFICTVSTSMHLVHHELDGIRGVHTAFYMCMCTCISTNAEFLIYDDACHLKKYSCNPVRCDKTPTQRISSLTTVVDKFHFKGHVDPWCHENCNPYKFESLESVSVSHTVRAPPPLAIILVLMKYYKLSAWLSWTVKCP